MSVTINKYDECDALIKKVQDKINELKEENQRLIEENDKIKDEKFKDKTIAGLKQTLSKIRSSPVYVPTVLIDEIKEYQENHITEYHCGIKNFKYVIGSTYISNYIDVVCCVEGCKCKEKTFWY